MKHDSWYYIQSGLNLPNSVLPSKLTCSFWYRGTVTLPAEMSSWVTTKEALYYFFYYYFDFFFTECFIKIRSMLRYAVNFPGNLEETNLVWVPWQTQSCTTRLHSAFIQFTVVRIFLFCSTSKLSWMKPWTCWNEWQNSNWHQWDCNFTLPETEITSSTIEKQPSIHYCVERTSEK